MLISLIGKGDTGKTTALATFMLKHNYFGSHTEEVIKYAKFEAEINNTPNNWKQFLLYESPTEKIQDRTIYTAQKTFYFDGKTVQPFMSRQYLILQDNKYQRVVEKIPQPEKITGKIFSIQDIGGQKDLFHQQINSLRITDEVVLFVDSFEEQELDHYIKMLKAFNFDDIWLVVNKEDLLGEKAFEIRDKTISYLKENKITVKDSLITSALYKEDISDFFLKIVQNGKVRIYDKNILGIVRNKNRNLGTVRIYNKNKFLDNDNKIYTLSNTRFKLNEVESAQMSFVDVKMLYRGYLYGIRFAKNFLPSVLYDSSDEDKIEIPLRAIHVPGFNPDEHLLYSSFIHTIKDVKFGNLILNEGITTKEIFVVKKDTYDILDYYKL
jgi:GTPase SAR1 family protein